MVVSQTGPFPIDMTDEYSGDLVPDSEELVSETNNRVVIKAFAEEPQSGAPADFILTQTGSGRLTTRGRVTGLRVNVCAENAPWQGGPDEPQVRQNSSS